MENKVLCDNELKLPGKGDSESGRTLKICGQRYQEDEFELDSWWLKDWSSLPEKLETFHSNSGTGERERSQGSFQRPCCDVCAAHTLCAVSAP